MVTKFLNAKNIPMKQFLIIFIFYSVTMNTYAQSWNPFVNSTHISESPVNLSNGEFVELSFNIGNAGSLPLDNLDSPLRALVTLSGFEPQNTTAPVSSVSGASFFNVSYDQELNTYLFQQSVSIPPALNGGVNSVTIRVRVTRISTAEDPRNGFQVNITPPAYTSPFNNVNDDRAQVITYTLNSVLPVEMVRFTGEISDCNAILKWETASETNNDYFLVEKSTDAVQWAAAGKVAGNGNSLIPQYYEFSDIGIHSKETYYRLVQFDYDGTKEYSNIILVNSPDCANETYKVYPNPAQEIINIEYSSPVEEQSVSTLFSASGQLVKTVTLKNMNNRIYVGDLVPGSYLLQMQTSDKTQTHAIVIQR